MTTSLDRCGVVRGGFTGRVIRPDDAEYPAARSAWNGMSHRYPALIDRPPAQAT